MAVPTRRFFLTGLLGYSAASLPASDAILGAANPDTPYIAVTVSWYSRSIGRAGAAGSALVRLVRVRDSEVERQGYTDARRRINWPRLPVGIIYRFDVTRGCKGVTRSSFGYTQTIPAARIGHEGDNRGVQKGGMFNPGVIVEIP